MNFMAILMIGLMSLQGYPADWLSPKRVSGEWIITRISDGVECKVLLTPEYVEEHRSNRVISTDECLRILDRKPEYWRSNLPNLFLFIGEPSIKSRIRFTIKGSDRRNIKNLQGDEYIISKIF